MSVCVYSVFVLLLCVGRGLATGWSSVQGVPPTLYRLRNLKKNVLGPTKGRRAIIEYYTAILPSLHGVMGTFIKRGECCSLEHKFENSACCDATSEELVSRKTFEPIISRVGVYSITATSIPSTRYCFRQLGPSSPLTLTKGYFGIYTVAVVRKRTIPTERPPLVGEVSAILC
jgi:hypothetical protein